MGLKYNNRFRVLHGINKCICKGRRNYPALPADRMLILVARPLADSIYAVKGKQ